VCAITKAGVEHFPHQGADFNAGGGGKQIGGERPILELLGSSEMSLSNGVLSVLLPLGDLVLKSGDDDLFCGGDSLQVEGGEIA